MPNYKGHIAGGVMAFAVVAPFVATTATSVVTLGEWALFAIAGALFPDVDTKSKGQKLLYRGLFVVALALIIFQRFKALAFIALVSLVPLMVNHRGLLHRLWFVILVPVVLAGWLSYLFPAYSRCIMIDALFFIAGAISHLWLDVGFARMMRLR